MPDPQTPPTPIVPPLAESDDPDDLLNDDGTIKGSPAKEPDG